MWPQSLSSGALQHRHHSNYCHDDGMAKVFTYQQLQGRPMSSFAAHRDLTLNEACPSVLGEHTAEQTMQPYAPIEVHASMKISAPRRVYSKFEDANDTGTEFSSTSFAKCSAGGQEREESQAQFDYIGDLSATGPVPFDDPFTTGRLRVQFDNSRNEVTEYSPSSHGSPSQCIPAHPLAAAWDPIPSMSSEQGSEAFEGPNPTAGERYDLSRAPPSRCASNLALRAGTFDELVDDLPVSKYTQGSATLQQSNSAGFLSIRTNSGIPANGDVQISRRASTMIDRAGTFNELVSSPGNPVPSVPAASAALIENVQPLFNINASLDSCPPTRKASQIQQHAAGTSGGLPWQGSHEEPEGIDGSISRRYTNMCNSAGAFDELVDDDGDVLSTSESESNEEDDSADGPVISFSGMLSGLPADRAQECKPLPPVNGMRWQSMGPQNPHTDRGMMPATVDAMGIAGVLPSDLCSEASYGDQQNPLSMDSNDNTDAMKQFYLNASAALGSQEPSMLGEWFEDSLGGERCALIHSSLCDLLLRMLSWYVAQEVYGSNNHGTYPIKDCFGEISHNYWHHAQLLCRSDRSLRLTEANTGSLNRSRGSSAAPPSSRRAAMYDSMPVTAEHSTLSCTLSSALSIRTPRTVLQKFTKDDSEQLVSVLSTQEAYARVSSMQFAQNDVKRVSSGFRTSDAENVPRVLPLQLQVVLPHEQDTSAMEHAVLTPQVCFVC